MKTIRKDLKKGIYKVQVETREDLWYLSQVIDPGDLLRGKTVRKIKLGEEGDRNVKIIKKKIFIEITAERTDLSSPDALRVSGPITQGPEDVAIGSYHTFSIEEFTEIEIEKQWLRFQLDIMAEAASDRVAHILLVVMDRDEAFFARLKKYGYEAIASLKGNVEKKRVKEQFQGSFYHDIEKLIKEHDARTPFTTIIIASPSFWKEDLHKSMSDAALKAKIMFATVSSVGKTAFDELLRRDEVKSALKADKITKEVGNVEELLRRISTQGAAVYGMDETIKAGEAGAIESLLVTDTLILRMREAGSYEKLDALMRSVDSMDGKIIIISHEHEGGKRLDGLGGIAGLTRYTITP